MYYGDGGRGAREREKREAQERLFREILAASYEDPRVAQAAQEAQAQVPFVDESANAFNLPQPEGLVAREAIPAREAVAAREGGLNMQNALGRMYKEGLGPQALTLQNTLTDQGKDTRKLETEYRLKRQMQNEAFDRFGGVGGSSGLQPGYTMEIGPQGPKMAYDPAKAAQLSLDQDKQYFETGRNPRGKETSGVASGVTPKGASESATKRLKDLEEATSSRQGALANAQKFLDLIKSGEMKTGAGRKAASYIPGVYTAQGQLDEEFNAFTETAARQALKASGEVRPTDADVKGMKQAMFGAGRDEKTNINLLENYIKQQSQDENDYRSLKGLHPLEDSKYKEDYTNPPPIKSSMRKPGDIVNTKNGRVMIEKVNKDGSYEGRPLK